MKGGHMVKSKKSTKSLHPNLHQPSPNSPPSPMQTCQSLSRVRPCTWCMDSCGLVWCLSDPERSVQFDPVIISLSDSRAFSLPTCWYMYTVQWWPQRKTDCQGLLPILADSAEGSFKSLFLVAIKCFVSTFHAL